MSRWWRASGIYNPETSLFRAQLIGDSNSFLVVDLGGILVHFSSFQDQISTACLSLVYASLPNEVRSERESELEYYNYI